MNPIRNKTKWVPCGCLRQPVSNGANPAPSKNLTIKIIWPNLLNKKEGAR